MRRKITLIASLFLALCGLAATSTAEASASDPTVSLLSAGYSHSCAVIDGGVKCWGDNTYGQLGDGTLTNSRFPVSAIPAGSGVTAISAGYLSTCAVTSGGVKCWGDNTYGQLGDGTLTSSSSPVSASVAGSGVSAISVGFSNTCVVVDGGVKCWGDSTYGQLGNGSTIASRTPVTAIAAGSGATAVYIGYYGVGMSSVCAVVSGGAKCWGYNVDGQLGNGTTTSKAIPVTAIAAGSGVTSIDISRKHTCAVVSGGAKCWGYNAFGQLGDGTLINRTSPVTAMAAGSGVTGISTGYSSTCMVVSGGVKCWGENAYAQLGDGTLINNKTPAFTIPAGSGTTLMDTGRRHTCALVSGSVKCWGDNEFGQVGDVTYTPSSTPVSVTAPPTPSRTGYSLAGWSATEGGNAVSFPYKHELNAGISLFALWSADSHVVTFDSKGGSVVSVGSFVTDGSVAVPETPTRAGYTFLGWSATDGGTAVSFPYAPGGISDITLFALWSADSHVVTFNSKGGSAVSVGSFVTDGSVAVPETPTRAGYTFLGWSASDGGTAVSFPYSPSVTADITLFALWSADSHVVTFNSKGGSAVSAGSFVTDGSVAVPETPTRAGYTFLGWSATDGGTAASFPYASRGIADITLFALWRANTYTLNYYLDSFSGASPLASVSFTTGGTAIELTKPTRFGLIFAGWYSDESFTSKLGDAETSFSPTGTELVLAAYAKWVKNFSGLVAPVVSGISSVDRGVSAKVTAFGSGVSYSYQWLRDGVAIDGALTRKYVLTVADVGKTVSFRVCGSKALFETACLVSNSNLVQLGELVRKPNVLFKWTSVKVGAILQGRAGTWDAGVSLSYSWFRDGVEIAGENQATHQITTADRGHSITFRVVAQKFGYNTVTRTSLAKLIP